MPRGAPVPGLAPLMTHYGWSQRELARRADVHPKTISWLLRGRKFAHNETLWKLAQAFHLVDTTALTEEGPA